MVRRKPWYNTDRQAQRGWRWQSASVFIWLLSVSQIGLTEEAPALIPYVYDRLQGVYAVLERGQVDQAVADLNSLVTKSGLPAFDRAILNESLGYAYSQQSDYANAAQAFAAALAENVLPDSRQAQNRFNLAQMLFAAERPQAAAQQLEDYLAGLPKPDTEAQVLLCKAYIRFMQWQRAWEVITEVIARHNHAETAWLQLLLATQLELKKYTDAAQTLQRLLRREPTRLTYWQQLAAVYSEAGDAAKAVAVLELMLVRGLLTRAQDVEELALRQMQLGNPHRAGELLQEAMASGRLDKTEQRQAWLVQAWLLAREDEKARQVLTENAGNSSTGDLYLQLAQIEYKRENWDGVRKAVYAALDKGGLHQPGQAHLLLGIAYAKAGELDDADRAFSAAMRYKQTRKAARRWQKFIARSG